MQAKRFRVKGIILDLDGTIVNSKEAYLEAMKTAFSFFGQTVDASVALELPKRLEQNLPINDLLKGISPNEFLRVYLDAFYEATITKTTLVPGALLALEQLSKKARLMLATRRRVPKEQINQQLEKLGITQRFQYVTTACDIPNQKPCPDAFLESSRQLNIRASECLIVGDSVVDIRAGKAAGMRTAAVLSGIFTYEELKKENPDLIAENIAEIADFLE